jgi:putative glutamine amidotransferase
MNHPCNVSVTHIRFKWFFIMKMQLCLLIIITFLFLSCNRGPLHHRPIKVALSSATENYINWVHRIDSTIVTYDLKSLPIDTAIQLLANCDGIIFTGGEDVVPSYYGKTADSARCETNPSRDSLEFALIKKAFKLKMPVLGICRGQQLINVSQGGSLVVDIPADVPSSVTHRCDDYTRCFHHVKILSGTLLREVCKADTGWVTTNHHQAVENPGKDIRISAIASDGIPEAIEWSDPKDKGYFMAVQWHPERMKQGNPLSDPIVTAFLQACIIHSILK